MEILHHHRHHLFWYVLLVVAYFFSFTESISRRDFPAGFIFGGASSAYQVHIAYATALTLILYMLSTLILYVLILILCLGFSYFLLEV